MSNNLNWSGNKGLEPAASRQNRSPYNLPMNLGKSNSSKSAPEQGNGYFMDPLLTQQEPSAPLTHPSAPQPGTSMTQPGTSATQPDALIQPGTISQQRMSQPMDQMGPPPSTEPGYIPYFLARNIGKNVRAEFVLGTTQYQDKTGIIKEVGINYFVLHDTNYNTDVMCDLYSVKFIFFEINCSYKACSLIA
jgi:hypothetical protein